MVVLDEQEMQEELLHENRAVLADDFERSGLEAHRSELNDTEFLLFRQVLSLLNNFINLVALLVDRAREDGCTADNSPRLTQLGLLLILFKLFLLLRVLARAG